MGCMGMHRDCPGGRGARPRACGLTIELMRPFGRARRTRRSEATRERCESAARALQRGAR